MTSASDSILMIGWEYPPHNSGGLGVACKGLTQALANQNTRIYFTLPYPLSQQPKHMRLLSCYDSDWGKWQIDRPPFTAYVESESVSSLKTEPQLDSHELRTLPQSEIERKVQEYSHLVEKQALAYQNDYDLIHAHDWMSFPAGINLKNKTHKPLVSHVHSTEYDRIPDGNGSAYIQSVEQEGLVKSDVIIAVSYFTKRLLIDKYELDPAKIQVVHNGVAPLSYEPNKDRSNFSLKRPVVSFMGRLTNQKGAHHFINVGRKVMQRFPQVLFVLAGSGHLYHELLVHSAGQELTAHVLFSGFVRGEQKRRLLERTDVFVMPSVSEPFGLVALEAAQHQVPVIVSKNSGVSEILQSCIQTDFWDEELMAQKIIELLSNQGYRQEIVTQQNQELNYATWDRAAHQLKQVYRTAVLGS
jgi:glycosyltransferase involved in cell wall biosynthesis